MVFSVAISLHTPLKEPPFCRIAKKPALKRDEQQVADLISHLQEKMINPFDIQQPPPESSNVSTGLKVSTEVQEPHAQVHQ
jgi:hypothetical protein